MQAQKYSIKDWSKDDRPREKLLIKGAPSLSDSELFAIIIGEGYREKNALDLAKDLMSAGKNNLHDLGKMSTREVMKIKGFGTAKAVTIIATMELGRRRQSLCSREKPSVSNSSDVASYLQAQFRDYAHEVFAAVFLNRSNKINSFDIISHGGITATIADPRIILKKALEVNAVSIILCHNHPSGSLRPSKADEDLTYKIREAARYFDIKLLDHLIVSDDGYYSFADEGRL